MTVPAAERKAGPFNGNGSTTEFPFEFKVFTTADIEVVFADVDGIESVLELDSDYSVELNVDQDATPGGTVTYPISGTALATGEKLSVAGALAYEQETDIPTGGNFNPTVLENALDKLSMQTQQLAEAVSRAAKVPITNEADAADLSAAILLAADNLAGLQTIVANIDDIQTVADDLNEGVSEINTVATSIANVDAVGGSISNVNAVAGNSTNINTVATNIASVQSAATNMAAIIAAPTQATNAASSASAAAGSAAAAAASAASGMYSAVQDKSANYTVVAGDAGDLIRVTTTSGAVTVTLPAISSVSDGFKVAIVKWTADSNAVTIARSSSDTINGATSSSIGSQYTQITFVADFESNQWFAATSGLGSTNVVVDSFSGNGSTVAFTLSGDAGSENNTQVYVGGVYQEKDTYSLSGTTLTFSSAPPSGTSNIEVVWTQPLPVGVPSDGTVTTAKIAANAVGVAKMAREGTTGQVLTSNGAGADPSYQTVSNSYVGGRGQAFTTTGAGQTFTIPTGITAVKVTVVGAGGGGANYTPCYGTSGGGGAGATAIKYLTGLTPGNTLTVTVGAGGATASSGGTSSVASGTQSITTITSTGGSAGGTVLGGAGGAASNGDINSGGGYGAIGPGGSSSFGSGSTVAVAAAVPAATARGAGGGGGGTYSGGGSNGNTGGAGAAGVVIFEW